MTDIKSINERMHEALAQSLLDRITDGTATAADLSVARQFLKDNNINCDGRNNGKVKSIAESLPDLDADNVVMN